jgi:pectate lyase
MLVNERVSEQFKTTQLALACALACASLQAGAQTLAFPGAVGFGANATGGRGGTVVHVTNLNDSGPGSFRDAVSAKGRIVVFDVGGYIVLKSPVSVQSNITIAGQTAPGDGIGIMAGEVSLSGKSNIIIRNLRVRQGTLDPQTGKSALNMGTGSNIILDHCSFHYGQWDSIDAVKTANFTVQNTIIANPVGQQFGAHVEGGPSTFYRNLWVNGHNRQPLSKDDTQYINNIVYDYQAGYTVGNTGGLFKHDLVGNYFIAGPRTTSTGNFYYQVNANQTIYAAGNYADTDRDGQLDGNPQDAKVGSAVMTNTPWAPTTRAIPALSAANAFASVTASAGVWPRDAVDEFAVNDTLSIGKTGNLYSNQANTGLPNGGYGNLAGGTAQPDLNGDGIPDYWAQAYGIGVNDPAAALAAFGTSGYTNIEAYVNSLVLSDLWTAQDLGGAAPQGASTYNALTQQWVLTGSGTAIDATQFASRPWNANGIATARIDALPSGQAGIVIRNPAANGAAFVALSVDAAGMLRLSARQDDGGTVSAVQRSGAGPGTWVRLQQNGSTFTAYTSVDGANWLAGDTIQANLSATARAGVAVAAASAGARAAATLSHVATGANLYEDLTANVKVVQSGFTLNRTTGLWNGTVTLTNTSDAPLAGTLLLRLDSLTSGVVLGNAAAAVAGAPVVALPVTALAPGASATVTTSFVNPNRVAIGYVPKLYSGTL